MALNNFSARIVGRSGGYNAVCSAAYIDRACYRDEQTGVTYDFRSRGNVESSGVFAPRYAPDWMKKADSYANGIERTENASKRPHDAQLFREIIAALPHELTPDQRRRMMTDFARALSRQGYVVHFAVHPPDPHGDDRNYHAHIHISLREITPEGFGKKFSSMTDTLSQWKRQEKEFLEGIKERFSELGENQLQRAGFPVEAAQFRFELRSREEKIKRADERGDIEYADKLRHNEPNIKLGPRVAALERKGIKTEIGNIYRDIRSGNEKRAAARQQGIEIPALSRIPERPDHLRGIPANIWDTMQQTDSAKAFRAGLAQQGLRVAVVQPEDRTAKGETVNGQSIYARPGTYVAVSRGGYVYFFNERTTGHKSADVQKFMRGLDPEKLPSVSATRDMLDAQRELKGNTPPPISSRFGDLTQHQPQRPVKELSPQESAALGEKLKALGFDPAKREIVTAWQRLDEKVDAGQMTDKERIRAMNFIAWYAADRERTNDAKDRPRPPDRHREPDRDR